MQWQPEALPPVCDMAKIARDFGRIARSQPSRMHPTSPIRPRSALAEFMLPWLFFSATLLYYNAAHPIRCVNAAVKHRTNARTSSHT